MGVLAIAGEYLRQPCARCPTARLRSPGRSMATAFLFLPILLLRRHPAPQSGRESMERQGGHSAHWRIDLSARSVRQRKSGQGVPIQSTRPWAAVVAERAGSWASPAPVGWPNGVRCSGEPAGAGGKSGLGIGHPAAWFRASSADGASPASAGGTLRGLASVYSSGRLCAFSHAAMAASSTVPTATHRVKTSTSWLPAVSEQTFSSRKTAVAVSAVRLFPSTKG